MLQLLKDRVVLKLSGADRIKFLQGVITKNCSNLTVNIFFYSLMLTPQGKYLYDFFIVNSDNSVYFDIAEELCDEFVKRINIYKLRSDIAIDLCPELSVAVTETTGAMDEEFLFASEDPRSDKIGTRIIANQEVINKLITADHNFYHTSRIKNLIPEGFYDMIQNSSFPLEYGFDHIGAIDFDKGCYVGQEVITRTHFRGTIRKKLFLLISENPFPKKGEEIFFQNKRIGITASSSGNMGLALLRIEDVLDNKINSLIINNLEYRIISGNNVNYT